MKTAHNNKQLTITHLHTVSGKNHNDRNDRCSAYDNGQQVVIYKIVTEKDTYQMQFIGKEIISKQ